MGIREIHESPVPRRARSNVLEWEEESDAKQRQKEITRKGPATEAQGKQGNEMRLVGRR